ncbi:MAG: hypothetical protein ACYS26_05385 [Planctomycetota bacterium]|jgi:hypothetical protein
MDKLLKSEIDKAKKLLKDNGYQTYNLWHIDDVLDEEGLLEDGDKMEILEEALTNEWVIEQIFYIINDIRDSYIEEVKNKKA